MGMGVVIRGLENVQQVEANFQGLRFLSRDNSLRMLRKRCVLFEWHTLARAPAIAFKPEM